MSDGVDTVRSNRHGVSQDGDEVLVRKDGEGMARNVGFDETAAGRAASLA